jgi:hypothetical protein
MYNLLKDKISVVKLLGYFIYSDIYIKSDDEIKTKLDLIFPEQLYMLYSKNKEAIELKNSYLYIYILKYEKKDTNMYCLMNNLYNESEYDSLDRIFSFFIVWIACTIEELNIKYKIHHNDIKLDNILVSKKKWEYTTKYHFSNTILYNDSLYDFYLNDFDTSTQFKDGGDIIKIKNSIMKFFNGKQTTKFNRYIIKKLQQIDHENQIGIRWLDSSSLAKSKKISNIINVFLETVL